MRALRAAPWLALAPALASLVAEATGQDGRRLHLIRLSAFGLLHPLPAYPLVAVAMAQRRRFFAAAAVAVAARHAVLRATARTGRDPTGSGPRFTIVTANLARDQPDDDRLARRLVELDPDVLLLQELTPSNLAALDHTGLPGHFGHRFEDPHDGYFGSAVYSHHPIRSPRVVELGERRASMAVVELPGAAVTVVPVHTQAPVKQRDLLPWQRGFTDLGALADRADGPVVLAGDWNATWANRPFRRMLRMHRLHDAHADVGRPGARTWPSHGRPLPPLLGLDHVVVSSDVGVVGVEEHQAPGSDHRLVLARLEL